MGKWGMVRLGDIAKIQSGGTPSRKNTDFWIDGDIPWVKISDLTGSGVFKTEEHITKQGLENSSAKIFTAGTILYTIFATLGEVDMLRINATTNQAIAGININDTSIVDSRYLVSYLKSIKSRVIDLGRGVAQNNINLSILRDFMIPLPPLDIQQNIADILYISSAALEKRRAQIDKLNLLVKSQFMGIFGKIGENVPLSYYIKSLSAGKSLAGKEVCKNKVLKTGAATYDFFDPTQVKDLPIDYKPSPEHRIRSGDIIISRMNTAELVGAAAYVWNAPENTYLPDRLWKAKLQDNAHPIFVWQMIVQPLTKNIIKSVAGGTSGSMKNISKTNFLKIPVIKANLSIQNQFASFVQQVETQKSLLQASLDKLELNHKSLIQKAFRGELF